MPEADAPNRYITSARLIRRRLLEYGLFEIPCVFLTNFSHSGGSCAVCERPLNGDLEVYREFYLDYSFVKCKLRFSKEFDRRDFRLNSRPTTFKSQFLYCNYQTTGLSKDLSRSIIILRSGVRILAFICASAHL